MPENEIPPAMRVDIYWVGDDANTVPFFVGGCGHPPLHYLINLIRRQGVYSCPVSSNFFIFLISSATIETERINANVSDIGAV